VRPGDERRGLERPETGGQRGAGARPGWARGAGGGGGGCPFIV